MKECELCHNMPAKMLCESDKASLCWNCDTKVHSANFLVARHVRRLLCQSCNGATEWQASGVNPCPTQSLCGKCFSRSADTRNRAEESDNQVVPASSTRSICGGDGGGGGGSSLCNDIVSKKKMNTLDIK